MYEGLNKVFGGIFIATFNINLGPIKILPAFVGFMIISSGINTIYTEHPYDEFKMALDFSRVLISISLLGDLVEFFTQDSYKYSLILQIWPIIFMIVELLMFYYLFVGIILHFESIGNVSVAERIIGSSRLYMIIFISSISFLSFVMLFNLGGFNTLLAIVFIILRISLMVMISGLKKDLIPDNLDEGEGV